MTRKTRSTTSKRAHGLPDRCPACGQTIWRNALGYTNFWPAFGCCMDCINRAFGAKPPNDCEDCQP